MKRFMRSFNNAAAATANAGASACCAHSDMNTAIVLDVIVMASIFVVLPIITILSIINVTEYGQYGQAVS